MDYQLENRIKFFRDVQKPGKKNRFKLERNRFGLDIRKKMSNDKIWLRMEPTVFK